MANNQDNYGCPKCGSREFWQYEQSRNEYIFNGDFLKMDSHPQESEAMTCMGCGSAVNETASIEQRRIVLEGTE